MLRPKFAIPPQRKCVLRSNVGAPSRQGLERGSSEAQRRFRGAPKRVQEQCSERPPVTGASARRPSVKPTFLGRSRSFTAESNVASCVTPTVWWRRAARLPDVLLTCSGRLPAFRAGACVPEGFQRNFAKLPAAQGALQRAALCDRSRVGRSALQKSVYKKKKGS